MPQPIISDDFEKPQTKPAPAGLDWLEQGFGQRRAGDDAAKKTKEAEEDKKQKEQLIRLRELDQRRSKQMYEEIQQAIAMVRKKKKMEPEKYVTGAVGYDPQQHQDPETFWQKVKKKQAEAKQKLMPWTSKQGMGTGEITRGVSG